MGNNLVIPAQVKECTNCNQVFDDVKQKGHWTTKLFRSKPVFAGKFRVLTITTILCGEHDTGLELEYNFKITLRMRHVTQVNSTRD